MGSVYTPSFRRMEWMKRMELRKMKEEAPVVITDDKSVAPPANKPAQKKNRRGRWRRGSKQNTMYDWRNEAPVDSTVQMPVAPTANETARKPVAPNANETARKPVAPTANETARKPVAPNANETARKPVAPNANETARKPVAPPANETARKPVAPTANETARKPVAPPANETARKPVAPPANETARKPVAPTANQTALKPVAPPANESAQQPVAPTANETAQKKQRRGRWRRGSKKNTLQDWRMVEPLRDGLLKKEFLTEDEAPVDNTDRKPVAPPANKTAQKKQHCEKWSRDSKQNISHDWRMVENLRDGLLKMEFSADGKFLAACTDDDPCGTSGSSSSSEANKENNSPGRLTRRQKKNRGRKEDTSPLKKKVKKDMKKKGKHEEPCPLKQRMKLNVNDTILFNTLKNYTLSVEDMMTLGYPVESKLYPGRAMIYRPGALDANAKEFVPRSDSVYTSLLVQNNYTDPFSKRQEQGYIKRNDFVTSEEKKCMRCNKGFFMSSDGEYLTQEHCTYHWGKLRSPPSGGLEWYYTCCKGRRESRGCNTAKLHVWSGVEPGRNGPFDGYVKTRQRKIPPQDGNYGAYALDCEMCFTNTGLELTKISVVSLNGNAVYETFVRPESYIVDYNTRFSGITAKDMSRSNKVKSLKDVQNDLMGFITADTLLIGHGLENDLRALRMIHYTVIDTSVVFPHVLGLPYRRSLKSLAHTFLHKEIQVGSHDSHEDACSAMELILWKMRKDQFQFHNNT